MSLAYHPEVFMLSYNSLIGAAVHQDAQIHWELLEEGRMDRRPALAEDIAELHLERRACLLKPRKPKSSWDSVCCRRHAQNIRQHLARLYYISDVPFISLDLNLIQKLECPIIFRTPPNTSVKIPAKNNKRS